MIIAIDGPAGAGKSTVAKRVAQALGLTYLDTGAMYRALTLVVLRRGLDPDAEQDCGLVAQSIQLSFDSEGRVQIDGELAEPAIRSERVTASVSAVSAFPAVRAAVVREQRALAETAGGLVAEGRDTTTVVFPDAAHKFFLIATPAERARRRSLELGQPSRQDEIRAEIERRDTLDSNRDLSPLVCADDAEVIDTTGIDAEQVIERILASVRAAKA
jgi:cytidylate kinase